MFSSCWLLKVSLFLSFSPILKQPVDDLLKIDSDFVPSPQVPPFAATMIYVNSIQVMLMPVVLILLIHSYVRYVVVVDNFPLRNKFCKAHKILDVY